MPTSALTAASLAPTIRIVLRYGSAALAVKGLLPAGTDAAADADLVATLTTVAGLLIAAGTEIWYSFAKRKGGAL